MEYIPILFRMTHSISSFSRLQARAAFWLCLAVRVVAYAREILRLEKTSPQQAFQKCEELELWLAMSLAEIGQDIETASKHPETQAIAAHITRTAQILVCLCLFTQRVKAKIAAKLAALPSADRFGAAHVRLPAALVYAPDYIDTS